MLKPEDYLSRILSNHSGSNLYSLAEVDAILAKLGQVIEKKNNVQDFWLLNFDQVVALLLFLLSKSSTAQHKETVLGSLDRLILA